MSASSPTCSPVCRSPPRPPSASATRDARLRIRTRSPKGDVVERHAFDASLKTDAARKRWARDREIYLTQNGIEEVVPTPTFEEFAGGSSTKGASPRTTSPSTIEARKRISGLHLKVKLDGRSAPLSAHAVRFLSAPPPNPACPFR